MRELTTRKELIARAAALHDGGKAQAALRLLRQLAEASEIYRDPDMLPKNKVDLHIIRLGLSRHRGIRLVCD